MKIKKILAQHRRDFTAVYICEHCGDEYEGSGYDDSYFHKEVIPAKICRKCGLTSLKGEYTPLTPKYEDGVQV